MHITALVPGLSLPTPSPCGSKNTSATMIRRDRRGLTVAVQELNYYDSDISTSRGPCYPGVLAARSSIPVLEPGTARHAASTGIPGPLQQRSTLPSPPNCIHVFWTSLSVSAGTGSSNSVSWPERQWQGYCLVSRSPRLHRPIAPHLF